MSPLIVIYFLFAAEIIDAMKAADTAGTGKIPYEKWIENMVDFLVNLPKPMKEDDAKILAMEVSFAAKFAQ